MSLLSQRRREECMMRLAKQRIRSSLSGRDGRSKEQGQVNSSSSSLASVALKPNQSHLSRCLKAVECQSYVNQPVGTVTSVALHQSVLSLRLSSKIERKGEK